MAKSRKVLYKSLSRLSKRLHKHRRESIKYGKINQRAPDNRLSALALPAVNPFLHAVAKAKHAEQVKRDRAEPDEPILVDYLPKPEPAPLRLAKHTNIFDTTKEETPSEQKNARISASILYVRYHSLDASLLARNVIPDRFKEDGIDEELLRKKVLKDSNRWQTDIMMFYLAGLQAIVQEMGGPELWKTATRKERLAVFGLVYDSGPLDMAIAALATAAPVVPLRDIYSDTTDDHLRWQRFHRQIFVTTCEDVFQLRIAGSQDKRKECFKRWKAVTASKEVQDLGLGGVGEVPVTWITSERRRQKRKPISFE